MSDHREPGLFAPFVRVTIEVRRSLISMDSQTRIVTLNEIETSEKGARRAILAEAEAAVDKLLKAGML